MQTCTNEAEHSAFNAPEYVAVFQALMGWIDEGVKPDPQSVAALCEQARAAFAGQCLFDTEYRAELP